MDWQMLGAIAESLGAAGVIISLLYLAVQVRSSTRATRRQFSHEFKSSWCSFFRYIGSQETGGVWRTGLTNPESLTLEEYFQFSTLLLQAASMWEESFYAAQDKDVEKWLHLVMKFRVQRWFVSQVSRGGGRGVK